MKEKDVLNEYFDIGYHINDGKITKVFIKVKPEKVKNIKTSANGATKQWYVEKLGDVGNIVYDVRRKYNSTNSIVKYLVTTNITDSDKRMLLLYNDEINSKKKNSNIQRYSDPEFRKTFSELVNKKSRTRVISKKAKEMWKNARNNDLDLYQRMINSAKRKNYELAGYNMNYIEYQIAKSLTEIGIEWKYEPIVKLGDNTYRPDFLCGDIVIECYGDFWHANPKFFKSRKYTHKTRKVDDVRLYDIHKRENFIKNGYTYLFFWEDEIINNLNEIKNNLCGLKKN